MSDHQPPEIAAVLLADTVDQDDANGRIHLLGGGVRAIVTAQLPAMHGRLGMLVAIRTVEGPPAPAEMSVHLVDPDGDEIELVRGDLVPAAGGPGSIVWVGFNLPPLPLSMAGEHRVELRGVGAAAYSVSLDVMTSDAWDNEHESDEPAFRPFIAPGADRSN